VAGIPNQKAFPDLLDQNDIAKLTLALAQINNNGGYLGKPELGFAPVFLT
jgi:hypothetical protein